MSQGNENIFLVKVCVLHNKLYHNVGKSNLHSKGLQSPTIVTEIKQCKRN